MDLTVHEKKEGNSPFVFCDNFINNQENLYIISKAWKQKFLDTLKLMDSYITTLTNDEEIIDFDYSSIEQCLNYLTNITVEKEGGIEILKFINNYINIAHNVNENTIKDNAIKNKISYLKRYADRSLTMSESMSLMRKCSLRMAKFKEMELPSYRLSEHYYNTIKEG